MTKGFKSLKTKLKKGKASIEKQTKRITVDTLETVRADARANVAGNKSIYTGMLLNSFQISSWSRLDHGFDRQDFILRNVAPHAKYLEYGTGMRNIGTRADTRFAAPPLTGGLVSAIRKWMVVKGITPRTGSLDTSSYLIARSISNQGIPTGQAPKPFMKPAWVRQEEMYKKRMEWMVKRAFK